MEHRFTDHGSEHWREITPGQLATLNAACSGRFAVAHGGHHAAESHESGRLVRTPLKREPNLLLVSTWR